MLEPVPHIPTIDTPLNFLNFEERNIVSGALQKLAKFPDQLSNIYEVFKVGLMLLNYSTIYLYILYMVIFN